MIIVILFLIAVGMHVMMVRAMVGALIEMVSVLMMLVIIVISMVIAIIIAGGGCS